MPSRPITDEACTAEARNVKGRQGTPSEPPTNWTTGRTVIPPQPVTTCGDTDLEGKGRGTNKRAPTAGSGKDLIPQPTYTGHNGNAELATDPWGKRREGFNPTSRNPGTHCNARPVKQQYPPTSTSRTTLEGTPREKPQKGNPLAVLPRGSATGRPCRSSESSHQDSYWAKGCIIAFLKPA